MNSSIASVVAILALSLALPGCIADADDIDDSEAALDDESTNQSDDALTACVAAPAQETLAFTNLPGSASVGSPDPSKSSYYPDDFVIEFDAPPPGKAIFTYGGIVRTAYQALPGALPLHGTDCQRASVAMRVYAYLPSTPSQSTDCWVTAGAPRSSAARRPRHRRANSSRRR